MTQEIADNCLSADRKELDIAQEAEVFVFPASFAQQRLWFLDQLVPSNAFYNVSTAIRLTGVLDLTALEQTFNEIVRRHEALRTTFVMVQGQLVQAIAPAAPLGSFAPSLTISVAVIDTRMSATERETEVRRLATVEAQRPFDLATGPLLRVTLLQLGKSEHVLLLNLHHIVADGWSIGVLIRELGALYRAFVLDQPSFLPQLSLQYADFAEWQHQWLQGDVLETQLAYWRQQLDDIPILHLPTDRPRPPVPTYQGACQTLVLSKPLTEALKKLSQREGVTLFMTLLAAFQLLLYRYTEQDDIVVGSGIANRNRREIEGLIGFFVNSLVLRTDVSGNPTFLEMLSRVKEVALGAYAHQDLPFEKLVEELHPERDLSRNPLFQISFTLQNTPVEALELPDLTLSLLEFDSGTAKFDLEFHLWEDLETLRGQVVYSTDLFDDTTITRMLGHFQTLLESIVANPKQRVCELPLLTVAERQQLLIDWNDTRRDSRGECIHQLFEAQVERSPDAIAVIFENEQLTYRELNSRSNQLAHYLQQLGVVPDVLVGICIERSVEMLVGLLGILKAGGAYLPLDPAYPQERLSFMLEDAHASLVLTYTSRLEDNNSSIAPLFKEIWGDCHKLSVVCLNKDRETIAQQSQQNPTNGVKADNLAYVIYTSGSTGKPKGVAIQHRGLCNLAEAQIAAFNLQLGNRVLQFASLSFDASIFEIVMALRIGATLCLAKKESLLPGQALILLLRDKAITHVTLPPAVLVVLVEKELPALQTIIAAGESCSPDIIRRWAANRRFFNAYGPTEATVWATIAKISAGSEQLSIGRPISNTQVYILDSQLQPVPIGIKGELYISGDGLARGYLNRPELTALAFIAHPFSNEPGARLYKTGDIARYRPDGNIEFLGRLDAQLKIRGFRIELGEIEASLCQHPAVRETVVIAREDVPGDKRLVAYIVPDGQVVNPKSNHLRCFLLEKLPKYMVPSAFVVLESLPLTPNGKVDRNALTSDPVSRAMEFEYVAPRSPTQSTLAKIFAKVLNLERVGIHDNFFDLGGDSLLAVRLMAQIHKQFERELPLSTLFLNPTVEGLASALCSATDSLSWSPLVAIQPAGSNPPFFCVHPILGVVFPYYELAYQLGSDQPFYALQCVGLDGGPPLTRIEDMAARYVEALRTVQPEGPYFLGGWSFGGLVAFEMAQQLLSSGHQVALLAVFDTLAPVSTNKPSFWEVCNLVSTVGRYIWPFLLDYFYLVTAPNRHQSVVSKGKRLRDRWLKTNLSWHSILGQAAISNLITQEQKQRTLLTPKMRPIFPVFQANSGATLSYVAQTYPNRITLFRTSDRASIAHHDPTMGWSELTVQGVEVHIVPGNHLTMFRKPNVQVLAEQLKGCLKKAANSF